MQDPSTGRGEQQQEKYDFCNAIVFLGFVPLWDRLQAGRNSILDVFFAAGDFPPDEKKSSMRWEWLMVGSEGLEPPTSCL
jgi:hypothetical protein